MPKTLMVQANISRPTTNIKVENLEDIARDRERWKDIVIVVKDLQGLY